MPTTLIDTNVLIDVLEMRPVWGEWSARQIEFAAQDGDLLINQIVYGEVSVPFPSQPELDKRLNPSWLRREDLPWGAAFRAGKVHWKYRKNGGRKDAILPDFLIGAHAEIMNYRLLTRDALRFRTYFPSVTVIAPDTHP